MKKLVLLLAVVFSVSMFSCKSSDNAAEAAVADSVVAEEEVVEEVVEVADSVPADSVVAPADSVK